ncbi:hypothetical protein FDECE_9816 [Fusarium decemcellulare]|nr:hypothetical protein FDECE_9816 [Fusarium decemcellulare]
MMPLRRPRGAHHGAHRLDRSKPPKMPKNKNDDDDPDPVPFFPLAPVYFFLSALNQQKSEACPVSSFALVQTLAHKQANPPLRRRDLTVAANGLSRVTRLRMLRVPGIWKSDAPRANKKRRHKLSESCPLACRPTEAPPTTLFSQPRAGSKDSNP